MSEEGQEKHQIELGYTIADDGIHLSCRCGWHKCIGFDATPELAMEVAKQHRENPEAPGDKHEGET